MKRIAFPRKLSMPLLGLAAAATLVAVLGWQRPAPAGVGDRDAAPTAAAAPAGNPLGQLSRTELDSRPLSGRVEERLGAGSYTYMGVRLDDGGLFWTVTLGDGQPIGAEVKVRSMGRRTNFRSNRLQRTFPELVFGIVSRIS